MPHSVLAVIRGEKGIWSVQYIPIRELFELQSLGTCSTDNHEFAKVLLAIAAQQNALESVMAR